MRILITGAGGQLGRALVRTLAQHDLAPLGHADLDVRDADAVQRYVSHAAPDAIIHAAALTDTARCEREPELAMAVNAAGTAHVADAARRAGALLIAVSTNEVFDGKTRQPYIESDEPHPVNAYGASKLEGERAVLASGARAAIVRTSWVYGDGSTNFVTRVLNTARSGRPLRYVTDEVAAPTSASDLSAAIARLIEAREATGVYHLVNEGAASRYEWAAEIVRLADVGRLAIEAVTTLDLRADGYDGPRKPPYSVLENERGRALGITLRPWRAALAEHMQRLEVRADG